MLFGGGRKSDRVGNKTRRFFIAMTETANVKVNRLVVDAEIGVSVIQRSQTARRGAETFVAIYFFEVGRMKIEFFPAVTAGAGEPIRASIKILSYVFLCFPMHASFCLQFGKVGSFEVLPVMRINAREGVVTAPREGTQLRLESKKQKIEINSHQMQRLDQQLHITMRRRAEISIWAISSEHEVFTVLFLVILRVILLFDDVAWVLRGRVRTSPRAAFSKI